MSIEAKKVFIKIESAAEQQEHLKSGRKSFKVLQKGADKENLTGRAFGIIEKDSILKSKLDLEACEVKRKKLISQSSQTEVEEETKITEEDLTSIDGPSEKYWEVLAEKRRIAIVETLKENEELHNKVDTLEQELNESRKMLDETRNLVEILTEMLQENEEETDKSTEANESTYEDAHTEATE